MKNAQDQWDWVYGADNKPLRYWWDRRAPAAKNRDEYTRQQERYFVGGGTDITPELRRITASGKPLSPELQRRIDVNRDRGQR